MAVGAHEVDTYGWGAGKEVVSLLSGGPGLLIAKRVSERVDLLATSEAEPEPSEYRIREAKKALACSERHLAKWTAWESWVAAHIAKDAEGET